MISIKRERWVVVLDDTKIFCGLARHYQFKEIDDIGNTSIKTYLSENKARAGFEASWMNAKKFMADGRVKFVKTVESIEEVEE